MKKCFVFILLIPVYTYRAIHCAFFIMQYGTKKIELWVPRNMERGGGKEPPDYELLRNIFMFPHQVRGWFKEYYCHKDTVRWYNWINKKKHRENNGCFNGDKVMVFLFI